MVGKVPSDMDGNQSLEENLNFFAPFRFVVLYHHLPNDSSRASHWDLLIEHPLSSNDSLLSFELLVPPDKWTNATVATRLPDHRRLYLSYEGPIANDRGHVTCILHGSFNWVKATDCLLILRLKWEELDNPFGSTGDLLTRSFSGTLALQRNQNLPEFASGSWQLNLSKHWEDGESTADS